MIKFVSKDTKDIKLGSKQVLKVYKSDRVVWQKETKLYDYAFFDSEIGTNEDWAQTESGKWYLKKYEDKFIFFVRSDTLTFTLMNRIHIVLAGMEIPQPRTEESTEYSILPNINGVVLKGNSLLIEKKVEDKKYKTYVFISDNGQITGELKTRANTLIEMLEKQQDL